MKRIWTLLLTIVMLFSLAACGEKEATDIDATTTDDVVTTTDVDETTTVGESTTTTKASASTSTSTTGKTSTSATAKPTVKACSNADHWALLSKKILTCSVCGKSTTDATNPNPTTKPTAPKNKELYRLTYNTPNYYITFDVWENDPTAASIVSFSCDSSSLPYGDTCGCSASNALEGYTYHAATKTVKCPCGKFAFEDPEEFLDFTCTHERATFTILDASQPDYHEKMCDKCRNYLYPIIEPHTMVGGTCSGCGYTK